VRKSRDGRWSESAGISTEALAQACGCHPASGPHRNSSRARETGLGGQPLQRELPGAGKFEDAKRLDQTEEGRNLSLVAGDLNDDVRVGDIDNLRPEDVARSA